MPKLVCPRDHVFSISAMPAPGEYRYFHDERILEIARTTASAVVAAGPDSSEVDWAITDSLGEELKVLYFCPVCEALVMSQEAPPRSYLNI